eukprot:281684-Pyramimonas_sp.AAC.1
MRLRHPRSKPHSQRVERKTAGGVSLRHLEIKWRGDAPASEPRRGGAGKPASDGCHLAPKHAMELVCAQPRWGRALLLESTGDSTPS